MLTDVVTEPELTRYIANGDMNGLKRLLRERVRSAPDDARLHGQLGAVALTVQEPVAAEGNFGRAVELAPDDVRWHIGLGRSLHQQRRFDEALAVWQGALERFPGDASIHNDLGRTLNNAGALEAAARAFRQALTADPGFIEAWHNLGHVQRRLGDAGGSVRSFARALDLDPSHQASRLNLGLALLARSEVAEAEGHFRQVPAQAPQYAAARVQIGGCLIARRQFDQALKVLGQVTCAHPEMFEGWVNYGIALGALEQHDRAVDAFARAYAIDPAEAALAGRYASALVRVGRPHDAVQIARRILAAHGAPGRSAPSDALWHLGEVMRAAGRLDLAIQCYRLSAGDEANEARGRLYLGAALLEHGDLVEAGTHIDRALTLTPGWPSAVACKVALLERLGHDDEARLLLDLDRHVAAVQLQAPSGFTSLAAFNEALAERVLAEPSLQYERAGNATRLGRHSDALDIAGGGALGKLAAAIDAAVRDYLSALPRIAGHPLLGRRPAAWNLHMWTVVMGPGGHQVPHTHDEGFLSGVYYPRLPAIMADSDASQAGWLEVGRPTQNLIADSSPRVRLVRPRPGLLVIFPSYCFHRTIPFEADEPRISIAFDLSPTAWEP